MLSRIIVSIVVLAGITAGVWAWLTFGPSQWVAVTRSGGDAIERSEPYESAEACERSLTQQEQYVNRAKAGVADIETRCERSYWGLERYLPF